MSKVDFKFEGGVGKVSAFDGGVELHVKPLVLLGPALDGVKAKIESGEIDLIKGTDLDKEGLLKAIEFIKAEISK